MVEWRACWTLSLEVCGSNHEERKGDLIGHYPQVAPLAFLPGSFYRKIGICFGRCKIPEIVKFRRKNVNCIETFIVIYRPRTKWISDFNSCTNLLNLNAGYTIDWT